MSDFNSWTSSTAIVNSFGCNIESGFTTDQSSQVPSSLSYDTPPWYDLNGGQLDPLVFLEPMGLVPYPEVSPRDPQTLLQRPTCRPFHLNTQDAEILPYISRTFRHKSVPPSPRRNIHHHHNYSIPRPLHPSVSRSHHSKAHTSPSAARQRLYYTSCQYCRKHKIGCGSPDGKAGDGKACFQCFRRSIPCVYEERNRISKQSAK